MINSFLSIRKRLRFTILASLTAVSFSFSQDLNDTPLNDLPEIKETGEKDEAKAPMMEKNLVLKGNTLENLGRHEEAETSYLKALALSKKKQNDFVAGECLFHLTVLIGKDKIGDKPNPRIAEALPYYNQFWREHGANSPFSAKIAVAGIPAMRKAGKIKEAMVRLQSVIVAIAKLPGTPGLESAIDTYTAEYLKDHTLEQLKNHYYEFYGYHTHNKVTLSLRRIAIIGAYERALEPASPRRDEVKFANAKTIIKILFTELRSNFAPKDLPTFVLVRVGDYLRIVEADHQAARVYYEEALSRPEVHSYKFAALFGLGAVKARGPENQKKEALDLLKKAVADSADVSEQEEVLYLTTTIHAELGNHKAAIVGAKAYLKNQYYRRYSTKCRIILATSYEEEGQVDDALIAYPQIFSSSMRRRHDLVPTMQRWMELLWKRNRSRNGKSDRQFAYETGHQFIKLTRRASNKITPEEKAKWEKLSELVAKYEASTDTTKLAE